MNQTVTLTGRRRYRIQRRWFRAPLLVLQVEERRCGYTDDAHGLGRRYSSIQWRDARVEDLTLEEKP